MKKILSILMIAVSFLLNGFIFAEETSNDNEDWIVKADGYEITHEENILLNFDSWIGIEMIDNILVEKIYNVGVVNAITIYFPKFTSIHEVYNVCVLNAEKYDFKFSADATPPVYYLSSSGLILGCLVEGDNVTTVIRAAIEKENNFTVLDLILLYKYLKGISIGIEEIKLDYNCDGKVDIIDIAVLRRKVLKSDME